MTLLPDNLRGRLPPLRSQDGNSNPEVFLKFFTPDSSWTWWVTEGEAEDDDFRFFGFVQGFEEEWGYFLLSELETARGPFNMPIERDLYFEPSPFEQVVRSHR